MDKRKPKPPAVLKVIAYDVALGRHGSEPVEWLGQTFPKSFTAALMLEDQDQDSGLIWGVSWEVAFQTEPQVSPEVREVTVRGLWEHDFDGGQLREPATTDPESGKRRQTVLNFVQPPEWDWTGTSALKPVQPWQLRYVTDNLHLLRRAAFEVASRMSPMRSHIFPELVTWGSTSGDPWDKRPPVSLQEFAKQFNQWQGRRNLTDELLRDVAQHYMNEVKAAEREAREPTPVKALEQFYGKPRPTIDRWVKAATQRGFLPAAERGKVRKPTNRKGAR